MKKALKILGVLLIVAVVAAYFAITITVETIAKTQLDEFCKGFSSTAQVEYTDVNFNLFEIDLDIKGIKITPPGLNPFLIDTLSIRRFAPGKTEIPHELSIAVTGIHIDAIKMGPKGMQLLELGYDNLLGYVELDFKYDPETKELMLNNLGYGAKTVADVKIQMHLGNLDIDTNDYISFLKYSPQIQLHSATFEFHDDSFIERSLRTAAAKIEQPVDQLLMIAQLTVDNEINAAKDERTKTVLRKIKGYTIKPGSITIEARPEQPVSVGTIQALRHPKDLVKHLNIDVKLK